MAKTASKSSPHIKFSLQSEHFAVLIHFLYDHLTNFKFKPEYQQYSPLFLTHFPFF